MVATKPSNVVVQAITRLLVTAFVACVVWASTVSAQSYAFRGDSRATAVTPASLVGIDAMREYAGEAPESNAAGALPPNVTISKSLRPVAEKMLRHSPTFRRQCLRIANAPYLAITIEGFHPLPSEHARARTLFVRRDGVLHAEIQIAPLNNHVELIAHEIEHVIEQLDGIDLALHASLRGSAASKSDDGSFETVRAVRTGLTVAREVESFI